MNDTRTGFGTSADTMARALGLPSPGEPRTFGPCPKCFNESVYVRYHEGGRHDCSDRTCPLPPESCKYSKCADYRKEHFIIRCQTCGYSWQEATR